MIRDSARWARQLSGPWAPLINRVQSSVVARRALQSVVGIDHRRTLPAYASQPFSTWFARNYRGQGHGRRVILFADTYLNYHEPAIGIAAVRLIQALGWDVLLAEGCCQRPRISHGFLRQAKADGGKTMRRLDALPNGPVLVCEPGCASALTDDLPDLLDDASLGQRVRNRVMPVEQWILQQLEVHNTTLAPVQDQVLLHGHCHQKALYGTQHIHRILMRAGAAVTEPDSGCCGMAGSFGYEREHYEISQRIGDRVLFGAIADRPDALIVAAGFSCRHQIAHFTGRKAVHWLQAISG
ncbi:MAG: heterodisulfide reductase-related iron-sulfur binding cluster, partial [Saprospiraceae bacterium]|nr:heterodisulfide reductase-related iron-sulfur binding cluster [Saprospiraceae bacterium]